MARCEAERKGGATLEDSDSTPSPRTSSDDRGYRVISRNWQPRPGDETWLAPGPRGAVPGPAIAFEAPIPHRFRIGLELAATGMDVLRLRCRSKGAGGFRWRDAYVAVEPSGAVFHALDRVAMGVAPEGGRLRLELEGALQPGETLRGIALDPCDDRFREAAATPEMALRVERVAVLPVEAIPPWPQGANVTVRLDDDPAPDKRRRGTGKRDAVVFAWWIPDTDEARRIGAYYTALLRYHHADSRIFLGVNHGSHPESVAAVVDSGLDVQICPVPPEIEVTSDAGGFLAALEGLHRSPEPFDLVWFGHTKGASRVNDAYYRRVRFNLERRFWARRAAFERAFEIPCVGLAAAYFNPTSTYPFPGPWRGWLDELDALQRIYRDRYPPLGLSALDTFFVLRSEIVRAFCETVGPWFFRTDPGDYGASRWFFEMAFPSIATMQGYEPYIDMDVPGANDPRDDVMLDLDVKQTHRLALAELNCWRADPAGFQPRVLPWDREAWQARSTANGKR